MVNTRAKTGILKESGVDPQLRLLDTVRDSFTPRTPPIATPGSPAANQTVAAAAAKVHFNHLVAKVNAIYPEGRHRAWAKALHEENLGGKQERLGDADDAAKLARLVLAVRTEFVSAGLDETFFDLGDLAVRVDAKVKSLQYEVRASVIEKDSMAEMFLLGADAVSDKGVTMALVDFIKGFVPSTVHSAGGAQRIEVPGRRGPASAAPRRATAGARSEVSVKQLLQAVLNKIERLESFVKIQRSGAAEAVPPKRRHRQGLAGFHAGTTHTTPPVAFDRDAQRAVPQCFRCAKADKGVLYHHFRDCPLGGKKLHASESAAAFCIPVQEER
ncbi:hypothetical protein CYMTET_8086 [Cymbomonas tetramitiformis]|uniref:Uncharacterized protein n=1 Tax=Cymbomonas tetramitiformis TaxID=36881 RepID=A0AAE0GUD5_9CHLO|nr:hypothetical protein CYMTET_8086 [Cymbomonas tetramitiformis]